MPPELVFKTDGDSLDFKRKFKSTFPDMSATLKMLVITRESKVVASGVLLIEEIDTFTDVDIEHPTVTTPFIKVGLIGDIRIA